MRSIPGLHDYGRSSYWHYLSRTRRGNGNDASASAAASSLALCLPGEVMRGHIAWSAEVEGVLRPASFKHILVYRDPRDVVVSLYYWWSKQERRTYLPYRHFASLLSEHDKIAFLIEGTKGMDSSPSGVVNYPDVGTRFREFAGWFVDASCLKVRFEDLVSPSTRRTVCETVVRNLFPEADTGFEELSLRRMIDGMSPSGSKTFRKGTSGEWREVFSAEHKEMFKKCAGDTLVSLGYEKDLAW
ncbi:MAG: hypothetical protein ACRDJV_05030 [Actinomycetota bacterium]